MQANEPVPDSQGVGPMDYMYKVDDFCINSWTSSAFETAIVVEKANSAFRVCFDLGYATRQSVHCRHVFISDGKIEHVGGVASHANKRGLFSMSSAYYYVPSSIADDFKHIMKLFAEMAGRPHLAEAEVIPMTAGQSVKISNHVVQAFVTSPYSLGYIVHSRRKHLKSEHRGKSQETIQQLIKDSVEVFDEKQVAELAYTGDTTFDVFGHVPQPGSTREQSGDSLTRDQPDSTRDLPSSTWDRSGDGSTRDQSGDGSTRGQSGNGSILGPPHGSTPDLPHGSASDPPHGSAPDSPWQGSSPAHPDLLRVRLLITGVCYLHDSPGTSVEQTRIQGHMHLLELKKNSELFNDVHAIFLTHFSDQYQRGEDLKSWLAIANLPPKFANKITLGMNYFNARWKALAKVLNVNNFMVNCWSSAGLETCCVVTKQNSQLSVCFDVGYANYHSISCADVFISHGHGDHIAGVISHANKRIVMGFPPATYHVPAHLANNLRNIAECSARISSCEFLRGMKIVGMRIGAKLQFDKYHAVVAFPTKHSVPSQGYIIYTTERRLIPQFHGYSAAVIRQMAVDHVQIKDVYEFPDIAYTGDTMVDVYVHLAHADLLASRLLITEATYLSHDRVTPVEKARARGHTHLEEIKRNSDLFHRVGAVLLMHFSDRYTARDIRIFYNGICFPPWLKGKIYMALNYFNSERLDECVDD